MKLAYLVNQYPKTSHTFIRREIAAMEALGLMVERFSIRPTLESLEDEIDEAERGRTRVVLDRGVKGLLASAVSVGALVGGGGGATGVADASLERALVPLSLTARILKKY